jgi:hypothetical protein
MYPLKSRLLKILFLVPLPFICIVYALIFVFKISDIQDASKYGNNGVYEEIQRIHFERKDFVVYRTNCGATCDYGIVLMQERHFIPEMTWDPYVLRSYAHAKDVYFKKIGASTVILDKVSGYGNENSIEKDLSFHLEGGRDIEAINYYHQQLIDLPSTTLEEYKTRIKNLCAWSRSDEAYVQSCVYAKILSDEMSTGTIAMFAGQAQMEINSWNSLSMSDSELRSELLNNLKLSSEKCDYELGLKTSAYLYQFQGRRKLSDPTIDPLLKILVQKCSPCWGIPKGQCRE